ncbi:lysylphosphatidylglycerol synthase transmembrane domain-containing protein [Peristeroidobacter agariperforans]|uniref:lysylphosphatidylglycerol synthase transmembrane domain-containing protein n=1 Tax=Peristeroidobacter agariperforans TaxID=268404 RepID=UPI00101C97DA|nr:lysylphosphatidylglycerol synthase transmembrane domain-containing protein [Peristeroidobacter agariperforans]
MTQRKSLQLAVGLSLAALFLWLTLRQVALSDIENALGGADLSYVAAALMALMLGYGLRIQRWRLMLAGANPTLLWSDCAGPLLASFAANNILPFRVGDLLRAIAFNAKLGTTSGVVFATVFVERLLDLLVVLGMLGSALIILGNDATGLVGVSGIVLIAMAVLVLAVLIFPGIVQPLVLGLGNCAARLSPRLGQKIIAEVDRSLATLKHLAGGSRMLVLVLWSAAAWLAEGGAFWLTALSLPLLEKPNAGWLALPVSALATLVPSTPGYVGTFDYFTVRAMTALGNDVSYATVYAFLIHAVVWLPPTVGGGFYLILRQQRMRRDSMLS